MLIISSHKKITLENLQIFLYFFLTNKYKKSYNDLNKQKGYKMQTISATEIKQNSTRLQEALREDLLITKREKPFVVVMDYEKYKKLQQQDDLWSYWSDQELDNFSKIAIGLSNNDFDDEDEDYSQW